MNPSVPFSRLVPFLAMVAFTFLMLPSQAQISTPCTPSLISTFTPCLNFLTNSSATGGNPTSECCGSLKNLTSNGMDCLCVLLTGGVPFQIPINRSLAISLPSACNMPGTPVQCKASSSPLPAPGPASLGPSPSPRTSPSAGPTVPEPTPSTSPPQSSIIPGLTPPSPTVDTGIPTSTTPGSRPVLTPSAAVSSYSFSPSLLLVGLAFAVLKYN